MMKTLLAIALIVSTARSSAAADAQVGIDNFTFSPVTLSVTKDTRVVWTNKDDIPHTVVSADDPRSFKSPPLDTSDHFSFVFHHAGVYKYFCSIHPHMQGTIVVH